MSDDEDERNPALRRLARKNKQSPAYWGSKNMERKLAKKVGGRRTSGSGNKKEKGDVRKHGVTRIEHKATQNKSFSVTREMVHKIMNAGLANTEVPAIVIEFVDDQGNQELEVAVIPLFDLMSLINK